MASQAMNPFATEQDLNFDRHFKVAGSLKEALNNLDDINIRTRFAQTSDPVYLAFQHIESKPLKALAKEFVADVKNDIVHFVSNIFG